MDVMVNQAIGSTVAGELLNTFVTHHRSHFPLLVRVTDWKEETSILENHFVRPGVELVIHGWTRQTKVLAKAAGLYYAVPLTYGGQFHVRAKTFSGAVQLWNARPKSRLRVLRQDLEDPNLLAVGDLLRLKRSQDDDDDYSDGDRRRFVRETKKFLRCEKLHPGSGSAIDFRIPLTCSARFEEVLEDFPANPDTVHIRELVKTLSYRDVEVELVGPSPDRLEKDRDLPDRTSILLSDNVTEQAVYVSVESPSAPAFHLPLRTLIYVTIVRGLDKRCSPLLTKQAPKLSTLDRCVELLPPEVFDSLRPSQRSFESPDFVAEESRSIMKVPPTATQLDACSDESRTSGYPVPGSLSISIKANNGPERPRMPLTPSNLPKPQQQQGFLHHPVAHNDHLQGQVFPMSNVEQLSSLSEPETSFRDMGGLYSVPVDQSSVASPYAGQHHPANLQNQSVSSREGYENYHIQTLRSQTQTIHPQSQYIQPQMLSLQQQTLVRQQQVQTLEPRAQTYQSQVQSVQPHTEIHHSQMQTIQPQVQFSQAGMHPLQTHLQVTQPQMQMIQPQLQATQSQLHMFQPQLQMTQPQMQVSQPQLQPQMQMAQPHLQMIQPQMQISQPQLQMTQPQFQIPQPQMQLIQPHMHLGQPLGIQLQSQLAQPQVTLAQPHLQMTQPQIHVVQPHMQLAQPHMQLAQPQMQLAETQTQLTQPQLQMIQPQMQMAQLNQPVQLQTQMTSLSTLTGSYPTSSKKGRAPTIPQTPTTQFPGPPSWSHNVVQSELQAKSSSGSQALPSTQYSQPSSGGDANLVDSSRWHPESRNTDHLQRAQQQQQQQQQQEHPIEVPPGFGIVPLQSNGFTIPPGYVLVPINNSPSSVPSQQPTLTNQKQVKFSHPGDDDDSSDEDVKPEADVVAKKVAGFKLKIPDDGNLYDLSSKKFDELLTYLRIEPETMRTMKKTNLDGKKFAGMSEDHLILRNLANPVLMHFRRLTGKPQRKAFVL